MLGSRLCSPTGECPRCSDSYWGNSLRSHIIAYWLSSAWHVSRYLVVDASSPTYHSSVNLVRNDWDFFKLWKPTTSQGYCIIKSIQINCTINESTTNEARYQIDTRFPWNPTKDHRTGILVLSRIGVMYSTQVNSIPYIILTITQVPLPLLEENP